MRSKICIINKKRSDKIKNLISFSKKEKQPVACLIRNNLLKTNILKNINNHRFSRYHISRSMFIKKLLKYIGKKDKIISSTGYLSRDLYYHILKLKLKIYPFYMVGGMGHTSSVSLGYSLKTNNKVICLDGDGSFLMHLGSAVSIKKNSKKNLKYIFINNKSHESVGGQSTHIESQFRTFFQDH